jgi:hypothetical protein
VAKPALGQIQRPTSHPQTLLVCWTRNQKL